MNVLHAVRRTVGTALIAGMAVATIAVSGSAAAAIPAPPQCMLRTGQIFVTDNSAYGNNNGGITTVDPTTGTRGVLSENNSPIGGPAFETPWGITRDQNGDLLVAEQSIVAGGAVPSVIRVDRTTGARTLISSNASPAGGPSFSTPSGIAVESSGQILVVDMGAFGSGAVIRVDPATGARTLVSRNGAPAGGPQLNGPMDLAVAANGDIYVANTFGTNVIRVDPVTGARTMVSANGNPGGGNPFVWPWGMTIDAGGDILIADSQAFGGPGGIIRVDPATGARTVLSNNATGAGPQFSHPGDLVVEACTGTVLVTDSGTNSVYRVDPATGDRTLVSDNASPGTVAFAWPHGIVTRNGVPVEPPVGLPTVPADQRD